MCVMITEWQRCSLAQAWNPLTGTSLSPGFTVIGAIRDHSLGHLDAMKSQTKEVRLGRAGVAYLPISHFPK